ncbi:hypothetical protein ACFX1T_032818 [Malus domestica]
MEDQTGIVIGKIANNDGVMENINRLRRKNQKTHRLRGHDDIVTASFYEEMMFWCPHELEGTERFANRDCMMSCGDRYIDLKMFGHPHVLRNSKNLADQRDNDERTLQVGLRREHLVRYLTRSRSCNRAS